MKYAMSAALAAFSSLVMMGAALAGVAEQVVTVPEPEVASLFAAGAIGALLWVRHRRRK